jgi:hypothetical protein
MGGFTASSRYQRPNEFMSAEAREKMRDTAAMPITNSW